MTKLLLFLLLPSTAFAYIDPGSGSYFVQIISAGLLGGVFTLKYYWKEIKVYVGRIFSGREH